MATDQNNLDLYSESMSNMIQSLNKNANNQEYGPTAKAEMGINGTEGEWFYFDFVTGKAQKAKADALATCSHMLGVLIENKLNGEDGYFRYIGWHQHSGTWSLTANKQYYLSAATAGAMVTTPPALPNIILPLGYTRADTDQFFLRDESADIVAMVDPMTTRGDMIFRNSSNATARLPVGSAGQVITSDGTDASWGAVSSGGLPNAIVPIDYPTVSQAITGESAGAIIGLKAGAAVTSIADWAFKDGQQLVSLSGIEGDSSNGAVCIMGDFRILNTSDDVGIKGIYFKWQPSTTEAKVVNSGDRFRMWNCSHEQTSGVPMSLIDNSGDECHCRHIQIQAASNQIFQPIKNTGDRCIFEDGTFKGILGTGADAIKMDQVNDCLVKDMYIEWGSENNSIYGVLEASSAAEVGNRYENITVVGGGGGSACNGIFTNNNKSMFSRIILRDLNIGFRSLDDTIVSGLDTDGCQVGLQTQDDSGTYTNINLSGSVTDDIKTVAGSDQCQFNNVVITSSATNGSTIESDKCQFNNLYTDNDFTLNDADDNKFSNSYFGIDIIITGTSEDNLFNGCQLVGDWLDSSTNKKNHWMAPQEQAIVDLDGFGKYKDPQVACDAEPEDSAIFFRKGTYALTQAIVTKKGQSLLAVNRGEVKFDCTASRTTYTASTISWNTTGNVVDDSANGLGSFAVGMVIRGSGTANNNKLFRITVASASQLTLADNLVTTEVAGASMSLDEKIILYVGSRDDAPETAGSVAVTNDSVAMVGTGTTMTNKVSGNYIVIRAVAYELDVITDDLNWTVKKRYKGPTEPGLDYRALALDKNITIDGIDIEGYETRGGDTSDGLVDIFGVVDFQLKNISASCIQSTNRVMEVNDLYNSWMDNFSAEGDLSYYGISINYSDGNSFQGIQVKGLRRGFQFFECHWNAVNNSFALGCSDYGFNIRNDSRFNTFTGCHAIGCNAPGFTANSDHTTFNGCFSQYNNGSGFLLTESWCVVNGCNSSYNVEHGIEDSNGDNQVIGCVIYGNDSGNTDTYSGIYVGASGAHAHLTGNRISDNDHYQIDNAGASTFIEGNMTEGTLQTGEVNNTGTMYGSNWDWANSVMVYYGNQVINDKLGIGVIPTYPLELTQPGKTTWYVHFPGNDPEMQSLGHMYFKCQNGFKLFFGERTAIFMTIDGGGNLIEFDTYFLMNGHSIQDIGYLLGDATFLRIGAAGASGHGLTTENDLLIAGKLEVDGVAFFDGLANFYGNANLYSYLGMTANARIRDTNGNNDLLLLPTAQTAGQHPMWGLGAPNIVMLTKQTNLFKNHDHAAQPHPTFIVHSSTDPDTDNTQWRKESHDTNDSVSDVGKGGHIFKINGVNAFKITELKGHAVWLTNKSGAQIDAGQIVVADSANDDSVDLSGAAEAQPIGVAEKDVADDAAGWFVKSGIADVAMEDNTAATRSYWVKTSDTEAGYADATNAAPPGGTIAALEEHMREVGHCIESVAAGGGGTHILARCVIHFN